MAASKEEILEAISNMTVMEIVDLVKMMEDKFGMRRIHQPDHAVIESAGEHL